MTATATPHSEAPAPAKHIDPDGGDDGHDVPAAPAATDRELAASGGDVAPLLLTAGAAGLILAAGVALVAIRSRRRWSDI